MRKPETEIESMWRSSLGSSQFNAKLFKSNCKLTHNFSTILPTGTLILSLYSVMLFLVYEYGVPPWKLIFFFSPFLSVYLMSIWNDLLSRTLHWIMTNPYSYFKLFFVGFLGMDNLARESSTIMYPLTVLSNAFFIVPYFCQNLMLSFSFALNIVSFSPGARCPSNIFLFL